VAFFTSGGLARLLCSCRNFHGASWRSPRVKIIRVGAEGLTDSCSSSTESGELAGALPAQCTRSDVEQTSDVVGEVAGVGETYRHGDLCHGKVGV